MSVGRGISITESRGESSLERNYKSSRPIWLMSPWLKELGSGDSIPMISKREEDRHPRNQV